MVDLVEEEWEQDSKGEEALSGPAFFESFFQLADIWTPGIDGCAYAEFLTRLFRRITIKRASTKTGTRVTKIKPKIVVKVLNKDIKVRLATCAPPTCIPKPVFSFSVSTGSFQESRKPVGCRG